MRLRPFADASRSAVTVSVLDVVPMFIVMYCLSARGLRWVADGTGAQVVESAKSEREFPPGTVLGFEDSLYLMVVITPVGILRVYVCMFVFTC